MEAYSVLWQWIWCTVEPGTQVYTTTELHQQFQSATGISSTESEFVVAFTQCIRRLYPNLASGDILYGPDDTSFGLRVLSDLEKVVRYRFLPEMPSDIASEDILLMNRAKRPRNIEEDIQSEPKKIKSVDTDMSEEIVLGTPPSFPTQKNTLPSIPVFQRTQFDVRDSVAKLIQQLNQIMELSGEQMNGEHPLLLQSNMLLNQVVININQVVIDSTQP